MKSFISSFFHSRSIIQQQNATNEEDKAIRKKCILSNTQIVIWGCPFMIVEEAGLLFNCAVCLGNFVPTSWRNLLPSPPWIRVNSRTHNTGEEGGTFLRNVGIQLPPTLPNNPEDLFRPCDDVLTINNIRAVVSRGKAATFPPHWQYLSLQ